MNIQNPQVNRRIVTKTHLVKTWKLDCCHRKFHNLKAESVGQQIPFVWGGCSWTSHTRFCVFIKFKGRCNGFIQGNINPLFLD